MIFLGIDNGVTGSICAMTKRKKILFLIKTPIKEFPDYNKGKEVKINRIDFKELEGFLTNLMAIDESIFACIERPLKNPRLFKASISGVRSFESTLISLERFLIPYMVIDSKAWQPELKKKKGDDLKELSKKVGFEKFKISTYWNNDCDAVFIADYIRKKICK